MLKKNPYLTAIGCAMLVIFLDQVTKLWVMTSFALYESKTIISGFFSLTFVTNAGAAFGFLAGDHGPWRHIFFVVIAVVALVVLGFAIKHFCDRLPYVVAIGMIAGGAIGNLIDRLRYGSVVDFLDFYISGWHWPAFNVADSAITCGVGLFLLENFIAEREKQDITNNEGQQLHDK